MPTTPIPEQFVCPTVWKYSVIWVREFEDANGYDFLATICQHRDAHRRIVYYISNLGETALTKVKKQNFIIQRLLEGKTKVEDLAPYKVDGSNSDSWESLRNDGEELFALYSAELSPAPVRRIIDEVKAFIEAGEAHCAALLRHIADRTLEIQKAKQAEFEQRLAVDHSACLLDEIAGRARSSGELIDAKHSQVQIGFVYIFTNPLMPSVLKIGFTAGNPDRRAKELSAHHRLPLPFSVLAYWRTLDPYIVEQRVHERLAAAKIAGEFFTVEPEVARQTIANLVVEPYPQRTLLD